MLQAPLLGLYVGRAFLLTKGRNAWHSTWIRRYQGSHAVYETLELAQSNGERQRGPGNVFYIREMPVLCLKIASEILMESLVVLTDFYPDDPFGRWNREGASSVLKLRTPLGVILNAFSDEGAWLAPAPNPHSLIVAQGYPFEVPEVSEDERLRSWISKAKGPRKSLLWTVEENGYTFDGVRGIEAAFRSVNTPEDFEEVRLDLERQREQVLADAKAFLAEYEEWERQGLLEPETDR